MPLTERLSQPEESAAIIDRRLAEIDSELNAAERSTIDPDHVAATLAEFGELWDVLHSQEKTPIVYPLVKRVVYSDQQGGIQLVFRARIFDNLVFYPLDIHCVGCSSTTRSLSSYVARDVAVRKSRGS